MIQHIFITQVGTRAGQHRAGQGRAEQGKVAPPPPCPCHHFSPGPPL